jgi:hypothetical protein
MGNAARQEDLRAAGPATGLDADAAARLAQGAPTGPAGAVDELFLDRAITMAVAAAP